MLMISVALYLVIQMFIVWLIAIRFKNPSIVDVAWALGIMISAAIYLFSQEITTRNLIIFTLVFIWAVRLSGYIFFARIAKGEIDKRYNSLSKTWKINQSIGYLFNFQLQALLSWLIAIVFIFPGQSTHLSVCMFDIVSCVIIIVGIMGESMADQQLSAFKKAGSTDVCSMGLWKYSRHPNYFFEWIVWCGFCAFALRSEYGYFALISPITLYMILNYITGPITERGSLESRGESYQNYMKNTPMFWPKIKFIRGVRR